MSAASDEWDWALNDFVHRTARVAHAVVVSADGLLMARSERLPKDRADQLAAVISGLVSLTQGAANCFAGGSVIQCVVEMERGYLLINAIGDGGSLGVLADPHTDLGVVGYEIEKQVALLGRHLTPELRAPSAGATA